MIGAIPTTQTDGSDAADKAQHRKLVDAAQQFEAVFLGEMLKSAHFGESDEGSDGDASKDGSGTMQSMGTEALAKAIASAGGFGIAHKIVAEVEQEHARHEGGGKVQTTLKSAAGTPIRGLEEMP